MPPSRPIHIHTGELGPLGVELKTIGIPADNKTTIHRDDHYIFIVQQTGTFRWEVDFAGIHLSGASLLFIAPGQVHRHLAQKKAAGWLLFVAPERVNTLCRDIFDTHLHARQQVPLPAADAVFTLFPVLQQLLLPENTPLKTELIHSLTDTLVGMIASKIIQTHNTANILGSRRYRIAADFKQLVRERYKDLKQVQGYASLLNITPLYLNETLKQITGFPASYWIRQEILIEAKRLLHYTDIDVRQIAYELGYEDPAYFSRFFRHNAGIPASDFRNHGLSKHNH